MNQSEFDNLLQTATERDLTDGELARLERWLAANPADQAEWEELDRKSTRLNSSHVVISYAVFCLKKKKNILTRIESSHAWQ